MKCVLCNEAETVNHGDICPGCITHVSCGGCNASAETARADTWEGECTACGDNRWRFETPPTVADPPPQRIAV